jgi:hypothetical protein
MRSQKALHPSLRRVGAKIWMSAANVNKGFSVREIVAILDSVINVSNTRRGKPASGTRSVYGPTRQTHFDVSDETNVR